MLINRQEIEQSNRYGEKEENNNDFITAISFTLPLTRIRTGNFLVLEATSLQPVPQPLPKIHHFRDCLIN